ncbi:HIT family protein [Luteimicrobium sp. DT211]|uniref:HIT family protein n=1 Tax=Luteimicrobium sp. DT211 TaxID=3393412 RepID=UPI003CEC1F2F
MTDSALEAPNARECAFCAYLRGSRPYAFVARDQTTAVMVTREQRGYPHLLVIPVQHRMTILELTDSECAALGIAVRHAAFAINEAYQRPGISVWQNNGISASQSIGHVHFHVAGTLDSGGTEWGDVPEISLAKARRIAQRIRASWRNEHGIKEFRTVDE